MSHPDDTLVKRQTAYTGEVAHQYHNFPGNYDGLALNEYPESGGSVPRVDGAYYVIYDGQRMIFNREDESTRVDKSTLLKVDNYKILLEYAFKCPVISAITTIVPKENCEEVLKKSPTQCLKPILHSYPSPDANKLLNSISSKIEHEEVLSKLEAMELVMLPKKFTSNQDIVLEEVCRLLKKLKVEDKLYKFELILQMQCVIHKYAKTLEDIDRLEGVIGVPGTITAMDCQRQALRDEVMFEMALKIKDKYGIEDAAEISGFSIEELEAGKMKRRFL